MSQCLTQVPINADLQSIINRNMIGTLLKDNYTILVIFIILTVFLILILYYFGNNMRNTLKMYYKFNKKMELAPQPTDNQYDIQADDEMYSKDENDINKDIGLYHLQGRDEPMEYINKGKKDFLANVKTTYNDYNTEKSKYIKTTYNKPNDDIVDEDVLFSKHDDYEYSKKPENDDY